VIHTELVSFCLSEKAFVDHHCLCTMDGVRCVDSLAAGVAPHNSFRTLGPTLLISMAYLDLGKWLVTLESGYRFGYDLVLLMLCFNLSAILCQHLSSCIGMVTGKNLAEVRFCTPFLPLQVVELSSRPPYGELTGSS